MSAGAPAMTDAVRVRKLCRAGRWEGTTRGAAPGHIQCNVVILPAEPAEEFAGWCARNRSVAPILARSCPGDPRLPELGDVDLRRDLPSYRVIERGEPVAEVEDLAERWREDLIGFAFGCSFSLEDALRNAGVQLRYEDRGFGGAIYETNRETVPFGAYSAPLIVSMRPLRPAHAERARAVSARYPMLHGAPVHVGDPAEIGIQLDRPLDCIGKVDVDDDEVPVFWACGVTTHLALERARPPLAYTHVSGRMLVTDLVIE
jgi:uncharacterized protein YcsI (UPF0317 family)